MRFDGPGIGVEEGLEHVLAVQLLDALLEALVAPVQGLHDLALVLAGQLEAQPVVLDPLAPQLVQGGGVGSPVGILAAVVVLFVNAEIKPFLELATGMTGALGDALDVPVEDGERRRQLLVADGVIKLIGVDREFLDVGGGQEQPVAIDGFQV